MSRFKKGQQVVCVKKDRWRSTDGRYNGWGPEFNEVVSVYGFYEDAIIILEYLIYPDGIRAAFCERWFEPLSDISELEEILNAEAIEV